MSHIESKVHHKFFPWILFRIKRAKKRYFLFYIPHDYTKRNKKKKWEKEMKKKLKTVQWLWAMFVFRYDLIKYKPINKVATNKYFFSVPIFFSICNKSEQTTVKSTDIRKQGEKTRIRYMSVYIKALQVVYTVYCSLLRYAFDSSFLILCVCFVSCL